MRKVAFMKKRVFVALPISKELQEEILEWEERFLQLPVRWIKGKNLHVTLVPPWEEAEVHKVIESLSHSEKTIGEFEIKFNRVTFGPSLRSPRLIWAEGKTVGQLSVLRDQLFETLGFQKDSRSFRLHLTLARFRPEHFNSFANKDLNERVEWREPVKSFVLMESHLLPGGAEYEVLREYSLI